MATKAQARKRNTRRAAQRFDKDSADNWHAIPSKGQLFSLAIAAYNGANFPGAEILRSRDAAKEVISEAKEDGILD